MNTVKRPFKTRVLGAIMSAVLAIGALSPFASSAVNAWTWNTTSGTITMSDSDGSARIHNGDYSKNPRCNSKYVMANGEFIPVYCIEHGKALDTGNEVNRSTLSAGQTITSSGTTRTLSQDDVNNLGYIYLCGYNGQNGWGLPDQNIVGNASVNRSDSNFNGNLCKYVATQIMIWEITDQTTYYCDNPEVQSELDTLRGRVTEYKAYYLNASTYPSRDGGLTVYASEQGAIDHINPVNPSADRPTYHFAYDFPSWLNPGSFDTFSNWDKVKDIGEDDFTTDAINTRFTMSNWVTFPSNLGGGWIYTLNEVQLWTPTSGSRQLTISAVGSAKKAWLAFETPEIVMEQVHASYTVEKRTDDGRLASGAEFTVYSDAACTQVVGRLTEGTGNNAGHYYFTNDTLGTNVTENLTVTRYYRETGAPTHAINSDGSKTPITVLPEDMDSTIYSITMTFNYDAKSFSYTISSPSATLFTSGTYSNWNTTWSNANNVIALINTTRYGDTNGWMNTVSYPVNASIDLHKVCENENIIARGATFEAFSNYSNGTVSGSLGTLTYSNSGIYSLNNINLGMTTRNSSASLTKTIYLKEMSPANQYYNGSAWVDWDFVPNENIYKVELTYSRANNTLSYVITKIAPDGSTEVVKSSSISNYLNNNMSPVSVPNFNCVNIRTYNVYASLNINKVCEDDTNVIASGASFEAYNEYNNGTLSDSISALSDNGNGVYSLNDIYLGIVTRDGSEVIRRTVYVKETAPATCFFNGSEWVNWTFLPNNNIYKIELCYSRSENELTYVVTKIAEDGSETEVISEGIVGYLDNSYAPVTIPEFSVTNTRKADVRTILLSSSTGTHIAPSSSSITLVDTVMLNYLVVGETYRVSGSLVDAASGEDIGVSGETTFVATSSSMSVEVTFNNVSTTVANRNLVCFETLYDSSDNILGTHNDRNSLDQTISIPDIHTQFYDRALGVDSDIVTNGTVELVDTVYCENILPGTYTLTSVIMDKVTESPVLDSNGNPYVATTTFEVLEAGTFTVDVVFEAVDTTLLSGRTLVAFETLDYQGVVLITEMDYENPDQTLRVPKIETTLTDAATDTHSTIYSGACILEDVVAYENLEVGETYHMSGTLYNKETGEAILDANGNPITSSIDFVAETESGTVTVSFRVDTRSLVGKHIVAFEDCTYQEIPVAIHHSIDSEPQTVVVPSISTSATVNGSHIFTPADTITIVDDVTYSGLVPGRSYTIYGVLMDKRTNTAFQTSTCQGECTAQYEFTPTSESGTIRIEFVIKGSDVLNEQQLVVFETLRDTVTNQIVATESDINNSDQTVKAQYITSTGEAGSRTLVIGLVCAGVGAGLTVVLVLRKRKEQDA